MLDEALKHIDKSRYRALLVFKSHTHLLNFYHDNGEAISKLGGKFNSARLQVSFPSGAILSLATDLYPERHAGLEYHFVGYMAEPDPKFAEKIRGRVRDTDGIPAQVIV